MSRYVDIDNIEIDKYVTVWNCNCSEYGRQTVMAVDDLNYLPTVDAQPVIHGEWLESNDLTNSLRCSVCGAKALKHFYVSNTQVASNYCPNCGAKMRGEHNE